MIYFFPYMILYDRARSACKRVLTALLQPNSREFDPANSRFAEPVDLLCNSMGHCTARNGICQDVGIFVSLSRLSRRLRGT